MRLRSSGAERPSDMRKRKQANSDPDGNTPQKRSQPSFKSLLSDVGSSDSKLQLTAAIELRKLLFDSDHEHFTKIENANLVHRFEEFLEADCPQLRVEAALFLLRLFSRTMYTLDDWYQHKRMQIFLYLLDFPNDDVRHQAVSLLGRVATDSTGRDLVHQYDTVSHLVSKVMLPSMPLPILRAATWTLLKFCKSRSQPRRFVKVEDPNIKGNVYQPVDVCIARHVEKVKPAYNALCDLVCLSNDEKVLSNVCLVLSCLSDNRNYNIPVVIERDICRRLVHLLGYDSPSVVTPALRTIGNIASIQSEHIVEFGVLRFLVSFLEKSMEEEEVCRIIANITRGVHREKQVQAVIDAGLISRLLTLVENTKDENIRVMAAVAISNVITGVTEEDQIKSLVSCIEPLCNLLVFYHPDIVTASLDGLERILKDGESKAGENDYAKQIKEVGGLEKLKKLLTRRCPLNNRVFQMLEKYWRSR